MNSTSLGLGLAAALVLGLAASGRADDWYGPESGCSSCGGGGAPVGAVHHASAYVHSAWGHWVTGRRLVRLQGTAKHPLPLLTGPPFESVYKTPPPGRMSVYPGGQPMPGMVIEQPVTSPVVSQPVTGAGDELPLTRPVGVDPFGRPLSPPVQTPNR